MIASVPPPSLFHCFVLMKCDSCLYLPHRRHIASSLQRSMQGADRCLKWHSYDTLKSLCRQVCGLLTSEKVVAVVITGPPRVKSHDLPLPLPDRLSCFVHRFPRARLTKWIVSFAVFIVKIRRLKDRNRVNMSEQKLRQIQSVVPFYFVKAGYKYLRRHEITRRFEASDVRVEPATLSVVEASWNVMAHAQKPDFVFRRSGRVHLNRRGRQFSWLLAAEVCPSAVVMLDKPCSEVVWRVLATPPFASFPFTSPPVRHRVPSRFNWTLLHTLK